MTVLRALTFIACLFSTALVSADDDGLPFGNTEACMQGPLAEFGQYIGDWKIEDSTLAQDGSGWTDGEGARWIFTCLGNGTAIQDFWLPANGAVGTNLRTYKPDTGAWEIAWTVDKLAWLLAYPGRAGRRWQHRHALRRPRSDTAAAHYVLPGGQVGLEMEARILKRRRRNLA